MYTRTVPILMVVGTLGMASMGGGAPAAQGDFEWSGRLDQGQTLEIRGINGPIIATGASGGSAVVTATKHEGSRGDPANVRIEVVEHGDGVTICAVYPGRNGERANTCEAGDSQGKNMRDNDTEVRFRVQVPAGVRFEAMTVNGDVEATDLDGPVHAHTVNGDVEVSTSGAAEAQTVNGSVTASIGQSAWDGTLNFQTVNGSIEVHLPAGVGADVSAQNLNGGMESDFPLMVRGRWGPRELSGRIGDGGGRLELTTVNGTIRLIEQ